MNWKKLFAAFAALCVAVTSLGVVGYAENETAVFTDVHTDDWFFDAVNFVNNNSIMTGVSNSEFAPDGFVTRAMFVTALWRMEDKLQANLVMPFSDVAEDAYYAEAVRWAAAEKIVSGMTETSFAPDSKISREQMAAMIKRYADYKGAYTEADTDVSMFGDFDTEVSDYAVDSVKFCVAEGIINGKSESEISPKDNATRAETAAIITRVYAVVGKTDDIVILYTNDVHCGIDDNLGYSTLAAYKKRMQHTNEYVTLVDCGDSIQGDSAGTLSEGEYIIDIMNKVGYDYAIIGNHGFDFGFDRLHYLIEKANAQYLNCNIVYSGSGENKLSNTMPYIIKDYGDTKVAFIGVTTPYSITTSTPRRFMEDEKLVYTFSNQTENAFFDCIQENVNKCREEGADTVILLTHCGNTEEDRPYSSLDIIQKTNGVDVVLDAHSHSIIDSQTEKNKDGKDVLLSSTGTKLENIGKLVIEKDGDIRTSLVSDYKGFDKEVQALTDDINIKCDAQLGDIVAKTNGKLSINDEDGVRMIRTRELPIGDFCADAYRYVLGAEIGIINGGGVRADMPEGNVTIGDLMQIHPFGNEVCVYNVKGSQIIDALEWSMRGIKSEYKKDGKPVGEDGGLYQVSGLRFTVDTSIATSTEADENGMFKAINGERRVKDIEVLDENGNYVPIDPERKYSVASINYILKENGDGQTAFDGSEVIMGGGMLDCEVLVKYITEYLNGDLSAYSKVDNRINVK